MPDSKAKGQRLVKGMKKLPTMLTPCKATKIPKPIKFFILSFLLNSIVQPKETENKAATDINPTKAG